MTGRYHPRMTPELATEIRDTLASSTHGSPTIVENYAAGRMRPPFAPELAQEEHRALQLRSQWPACRMVLRGIMQDLDVTGVQGSPGLDTAWSAHLAPAFQAVVRAALTSGIGYSVLVPSGTGWKVIVRRMSETYAVWEDVETDTAPVVTAVRHGGEIIAWERGSCYRIGTGPELTISEPTTSAVLFAGLAPVAALKAGDLIVDVTGTMRWSGVIEPLIGANDRLNQAAFDLLLVSSYGAVTLRYIAGVDLPEDDDSAREVKLKMAVDRILASSNPDTKFGSLIGTPMEPYIRHVASALGDLAVQANVPPNRLLADIQNIGADTVSNIREGYESMLANLRMAFERVLEPHLRAIAVATSGLTSDPGTSGYLVWRSTELTGVASVFDAVTKAHSVGMNAAAVVQRYLPWRGEDIAALTEGYQDARAAAAASSSAQAIVEAAARASRATAMADPADPAAAEA